MTRTRSGFLPRLWTAFTRRGRWRDLDTTDPHRVMSNHHTHRGAWDNLSTHHRGDHGAGSHNLPGPGGEY